MLWFGFKAPKLLCRYCWNKMFSVDRGTVRIYNQSALDPTEQKFLVGQNMQKLQLFVMQKIKNFKMVLSIYNGIYT